MEYKFDLQVHSEHSFDSDLSIDSIIKMSKKKGLSGVCITDHNTGLGSLEAFKKTRKDDFLAIPGTEICTQYGDVIVMFIKEEIQTKDYYEIVEKAKEEDYILNFPHPYRSHTNIENIAKDTDCIEIANGRSRLTQNLSALYLQQNHGKTKTAGSDAHTLDEIGNCYTVFRDNTEESIRRDFKNGYTEVHGFFNTYKNIFKQFGKKYIK